jgi:DNA repair protein RecN (Recombination protein N)
MIAELRVQNMLLIERAELRLAAGLNVLTGETGAGKTVLAHALDLLLGGKPRAGLVRPGASEAYVEGAFVISRERLTQLPALAAEHEDEAGAVDGLVEVVLGRRVNADGRTRAYLNGRTATVADLREIGSELISFYGQHEHRKLTLAAAQLEVLDRFCGSEQAERRADCERALAEVRGAEAELDRLRELEGARERELDLLEFELEEIEQFAPERGEHEALLAKRERLRRLDALRAAAAHALQALTGGEEDLEGAARLAAGAASGVEAQRGVDPRLDALGERCTALALELEDLAGELRDYGETLDGEDGELEGLEERLSGLERLMRKHGGGIESVLEHAERSRARRDELLGAEVAASEAEVRVADASERLDRDVQALRAAREQAAPRLAAAVLAELSELAMPEASFEVQLSEREPTGAGADAVELTIAPNPGVAAGPLREIASGGELSRTMLALIAAADEGLAGGEAPAPATLVFDEIDAGIGGHTARAVGERLRRLAEHRQVLCITHLPQVASLAHRHFAIVKDTSADPSRTDVSELTETEVVGELVRMLGAADSDLAARRHAKELLKAA